MTNRRRLLVGVLELCLLLSIMATVGCRRHNKRSGYDWTVMVYMAADNDLGIDGALNYAERDLNEMETVGSTALVNILVQVDLYADQAKRYRIIRDNDQAQVNSPPLMQLGETNTGEQETLRDFLRWGVSNFPARHYLVVLWNHGSGIADEQRSPVQTRAICYDQDGGAGAQDWLTVKEVKAALVEALVDRPVDLLITDACLMQMAEVAVEWQGVAAYLVGSEETTPVDGLPYDTILQRLVLNSDYHPEQFIPELLWCYADYYQNYNPGFPWTISAVDLGAAGIKQFNAAIARLVAAFRVETNDAIRTEVKRLSRKTKSYYAYPEYKDLGHFLNSISGSPLIPNLSELHKSALAAREALRQIIVDNEVINACTIGEDNGLSVLLPDNVDDWYLYSPFYSEMSFAQATGWDYLIEELQAITNY